MSEIESNDGDLGDIPAESGVKSDIDAANQVNGELGDKVGQREDKDEDDDDESDVKDEDNEGSEVDVPEGEYVNIQFPRLPCVALTTCRYIVEAIKDHRIWGKKKIVRIFFLSDLIPC